MKDKLLVTVVGNRNSGKSKTWNALFGRTVRTGKGLRRLYLTPAEHVEVFLVSGSPEERHTRIEKIVARKRPAIVLCSVQYRAEAIQTINYFVKNRFSIYAQWLNPGFSDSIRQPDSLALTTYLLNRGAVVSMRNGRINPASRVRELKEFIAAWARSRGLLAL